METWERIVRLGRYQYGVFALRQAVQLGLDPRTLQRHAESRGVTRLHLGVYALQGAPPTYERAAMAAQLAVGGPALLARRTAARLWGMTEARPRPIELIVPVGISPNRRQGIVVRRSRTLTPQDAADLDALALTCAERTIIDLAANAGVREVVGVAALGIRLNLVSRATLERRAREIGPVPGIGVVRAAIAELRLDGRTDSAFERRVRRFLRRHGLPPHPGVYPIKVRGRVIARLDIAYPRARVFVEADGFGWHSLPGQLHADRVRGNEIVALDWLPVHVTRREFDHHPERFLRQLKAVLELRGGTE